jgi:6-phosphogluconolactonase (cycloisomerase 2 family)
MTAMEPLRSRRNIRWILILAGAVFVAIIVQLLAPVEHRKLARASQLALRRPTGAPQLVSSEPLPQMEGETCPWAPASAQTLPVNYLQQRDLAAAAADEKNPSSEVVNLSPVRVIHDNYATYSAVAVDTRNNEILLQDENLFQILVYDRMASTPPTATMTEPKRIIGGPKTDVEFNCGLYVDQHTGDIYSVNNDSRNKMVVFSRDQKGDVPPTREVNTPHGTYGIAVDETKQLMYLTVEHDNAIVVYPKSAKEDEPPVRLIQGDHTGLADPHGITLDMKDGLIFVGNHGSRHLVSKDADFTKKADKAYAGTGREHWPLDRDAAVPGSGELLGPFISVYPMNASGDAAPLRVIQGPKTQLNWPATMSVDEQRGEIYIANDGGDSVLVFRVTDSGNVAPTRIVKGPKTGLKNPTGVFADLKNKEMVVSSMGNYSASVFPLMANGDVAPLRTIRSAPAGKQALAIGNPGGIAYDSKRSEILVPN